MLKKVFGLIQLIRVLLIHPSNIIWIYGHISGKSAIILRFKKFIIERTEYPYHIIIDKYSKKQDLTYYINASGFITCSDALIEYYSSFTNKDCGFLNASLLVDYDRFANEKYVNPIKGKRYIAYCGYMGNNKDGLYDLLEAFKLVSNKVKDLTLCLIGGAEESEMNKIRRYTAKLGLENDVVFTGYVEHEKIPEYLKFAEVLLLSRPANKQAEGGFPSKLGEYLATGNPVLVTAVGDIPNYIKARKNGFIVTPGNPKLFADELYYILTNKEVAKRVGKEGQALAKREFDYKVQAERLINFLD